jgi:glycosyltransferase involved in cell wall biosynthesis
MARVLMIGYGPLPGPGLSYCAGPALRTRHLLKALLEAGHTVNLFTLPLPGTEGREAAVPAMGSASYEGLAYQRFTSHRGEFATSALTEQARSLEPEAILGVASYPAYIGAKMATTIPLWADLDGSLMAETQGRCWVEGSDERLMSSWRISQAIARHLDKFSAASRPHLHATLGELAAVGRLNRHTYQYPFGHTLPHAAFSWFDAAGEEGEDEPVLRGPLLPSDAFIILWSGSFKAWCDVTTLTDAVGRLMKEHPALYFVSTGGRLGSGDPEIYRQFQELVEQSPFKNRFHLLGWVPSERLAQIHREADLGINIDGTNYQTMFGSRHRLVAMAGAGLPLATTLGTEFSEWLADGEAAISLPMGDGAAVAEAIAPLIARPERLADLRDRARQIMETDFSIQRTTRALIKWLENPQLAPDNQARIDQSSSPVADLSTVALNGVDEAALMMQRHGVDELLAALSGEQQTSTPPAGGGIWTRFFGSK